MAKVYKVSTGISYIAESRSYYRTIVNPLFNILNTCIPNNNLEIVDEYSTGICGIRGVGLDSISSYDVLELSGSSNVVYFRNSHQAYNINRYGKCIVYNLGDSNYPINEGSLNIYYIPIKNGVLISFCGSEDDYTKYFTKAFIRTDNNHILFFEFNDYTYSKTIFYRDLMVAEDPHYGNVTPLATPIIDSSKICMSKLIFGDTIFDSIYVASCAPIIPIIAQSFIINDKEYISIAQKDGYCPAVLECLNEN